MMMIDVDGDDPHDDVGSMGTMEEEEYFSIKTSPPLQDNTRSTRLSLHRLKSLFETF